MSILKINELALELVKRDFSDGHKPTNGGPTKTSRALAIIHLAAHDAYAKVTGKFAAQLASLPNKPASILADEASGLSALIGAGIRAAAQLYPDEAAFISTEAAKIIASGTNPIALRYGEQIADAWLNERKNDGSALPQEDELFDLQPGRHRRDPLNPKQTTLGRTWGLVKPFVLKNVVADAFLAPPPLLNSAEYAKAFDQVIDLGKSNIVEGGSDARKNATIGIFWGYDGANKLGTPPRLYNQVVLAIPEFKALAHAQQVRLLTAINVAMADAGIAAWYWKYEYDVWRPVVGIREADKGWGPTGKGDGNTLRQKGDPYWLPLGAPNSNPIAPKEPKTIASSSNPTPGFPAYPSGHATFGSACFEVAASLLCKKPEDINLKFVSDEFNGETTDNTGATRPRYEASFTLREAIEENKISRIYLGVHWLFDATGGEKVGKDVAAATFTAFK
jgi:membrane-associated phospholipid phosphatase